MESGMMAFDKEGNPIHHLSGSMLWLNPSRVIPSDWMLYFDDCVQYRERFGITISLPFWFLNGMSEVPPLIQEALARNRRRWVLECGPWASNPPITQFSDVLQRGGMSMDSLKLKDTFKLWLGPDEWIEA